MRQSIISLPLLLPLTLLAGHLGININFAERGGTFVDVAKEEYRWSTVPGGDELSALQVDEYGWPKVDAQFVVDYRPVAEWSGAIDDPDAYRIDASGTWKCVFTGSADVRGAGGGSVLNKAYDPASNTTIFDFAVTGPPGANHGLFIIEFTKTKRTAAAAVGSGITGFRMLRPGYTLTAAKTFTDEFIAALTGVKFSTIRFMNFTMTNGCDPTYPARMIWSKRKRTDDASQNRIAPLGKTDGAAWEYVIELCNLVHMDPWINIPVSADSGYVYEVAKMFKTSLSPDRNIYIESSNEVWNTAPGFEQSLYSQAEAKALGIGDQANHARRTIELAGIFAQVFGTETLNKRIRIILCSHKPMLKWWVSPMLDTITKAYGPPKNYIYAIACQTYFGSGNNPGESVDKILADCRKDITAQIDETGGTDEAGRKQWIQFANDRGLVGGFCSYEGGPDHGGGSTDNIANRISAERDSRMADIWTYNYDTAFLQLGGNIAMQFTLSSAYTRYGCWGLTDDISNPQRNGKYAAAKRVADKYPAAVTLIHPIDRVPHSMLSDVFTTDKSTRISYELPNPSDVVVTVWNIAGKILARAHFPAQAKGRHVVFLTSGCTTHGSGTRIVSMQTETTTDRRTFVHLR